MAQVARGAPSMHGACDWSRTARTSTTNDRFYGGSTAAAAWQHWFTALGGRATAAAFVPRRFEVRWRGRARLADLLRSERTAMAGAFATAVTTLAQNGALTHEERLAARFDPVFEIVDSRGEPAQPMPAVDWLLRDRDD